MASPGPAARARQACAQQLSASAQCRKWCRAGYGSPGAKKARWPLGPPGWNAMVCTSHRATAIKTWHGRPGGRM